MQIRSAVNHRVKTMLRRSFFPHKKKYKNLIMSFMLIQFYSQGMFWLHAIGLKKVFCSRLKAAEKETSKTDHKFKKCRDWRVSRLREH